MTILAFSVLVAAILLLADGAFNRGLLVSLIPNLNLPAIVLIRLVEVVTAGAVFLTLGFALSTTPCK